MKNFYRFLWAAILMATTTSSFAVTEYVSDQIQIKVHQQPDINSAITKTLGAGASVEVLQEHNGFKRVQLKDGTQGWIGADYLVANKPTATIESLSKQLEEKSQRLKKVERTLQVRRDELSNARSTISELKKQIASNDTGSEPDEELQQQLAEKQNQIEQLQEEIHTLQEEQPESNVNQPGVEQYKAQLAQQKDINQELRTRIELAQNLLTRDQLPSAEELDKWQITLPGWYWGTMLIALIVGIGGGIAWMDYRLRRRHGGFRI